MHHLLLQTLLGSMPFQDYATPTLPVGSLRVCGGERLAALQPSLAAHDMKPLVSSQSVSMHQVLLPQLMGLLAIAKLCDKYSTNGALSLRVWGGECLRALLPSLVARGT